MPSWYWLVLAAVFGVIEVAVPALVCIWLAAAALGVAATAWLVPGLSWEYQALVFAALAIAGVALGRMAFGRPRSPRSDRHLNRRAETYIGGCLHWTGRSSMAAGDCGSMTLCGLSPGRICRPERACE
jgi:inner membrane protein